MEVMERAYRKYGLQVYRRCLRLLRDRAEAEDAAHEVFLRAFGKLPRDEDETMAFLYRISTNYCLNRLRNRRMREQPHWQEGVRQAARRAAKNPERAAAQSELTLLLLGDQERETQEMALYYYVDGLSQGEIARVMGLSRATINRKLRTFAALAARKVEEATK